MKDIFLLDLDDTLVDFPRAEHENFFRTLRRCGVPCDETLYARFHAINDALWKAHERGEITRERLVVKRFEDLFSLMDVGGAERAAAEYMDGFADICFPFDGAAGFLRILSGRGRAYLVTNGSARVQRAHVRLAGFEESLSGMFISEELGFHKPMPEFAAHVEGAVEGYVRERAVWIGDSLTSDMLCAKSVGIDFIRFDPSAVTPLSPASAQYASILSSLGFTSE